MGICRAANTMKSFFLNKYVVYISRIILGLVFIYASYDKILDPVSFSSNIDNYHISPVALNNLAALIIPWLELIIGICLLIGVFLDGASLISIALLVFFIFIISQAYVRGISLHCGCFKSVTSMDFQNLRIDMLKRIFEDIIFLILGLIVYFRDRFNGEKY